MVEVELPYGANEHIHKIVWKIPEFYRAPIPCILYPGRLSDTVIENPFTDKHRFVLL